MLPGGIDVIGFSYQGKSNIQQIHALNNILKLINHAYPFSLLDTIFPTIYAYLYKNIFSLNCSILKDCSLVEISKIYRHSNYKIYYSFSNILVKIDVPIKKETNSQPFFEDIMLSLNPWFLSMASAKLLYKNSYTSLAKNWVF
ncbi:hypothetical protein HZS_4324 [Henneguya salminicola]|nr:hypothetical protein HZS_4324 [Henneguya salminicola]